MTSSSCRIVKSVVVRVRRVPVPAGSDSDRCALISAVGLLDQDWKNSWSLDEAPLALDPLRYSTKALLGKIVYARVRMADTAKPVIAGLDAVCRRGPTNDAVVIAALDRTVSGCPGSRFRWSR